MKYHFYFSFLLLALACQKTDSFPPLLPPEEGVPIDTSYGYPPQVVYNCMGFDSIGFDYSDLPGWEKTPLSSDFSTPGTILLYFLDEATGFRFGYDGTISKTTDGGNTWSEVYQLPSVLFTQCSFSSDKHGVVLCSNSFGSERFFLTTYDGGNTWIRSANMASNFTRVTNLQFVAPDLGYILAESSLTFTVSLYQTIDSAQTWTHVFQGGDQNYIAGLFFQNRDTGYYVTGSNLLYRTIDSGQQWASTEMLMYDATDVRFFDPSYGVLYGYSGVLITRSGGNRWEYISRRPTKFGRFFSNGSAVLFQQVRICNKTFNADIYAFVTTNDFGATWKVGPLTKTNVPSNHYCFVNERCIMSVGPEGKLYKWTRL